LKNYFQLINEISCLQTLGLPEPYHNSGAENRNQCVHGSVTTHIDSSVSFVSHTKRMIRFFINHINCFYLIYLTNNNFLLQAAVLGCELSSIRLFMETYIWSDNY
jgi:hypothetical protein